MQAVILRQAKVQWTVGVEMIYLPMIYVKTTDPQYQEKNQ